MSESKSQEMTVKQLAEQQKADTSWKKEPWINPKDGFEYRRQRVQNPDGTYTHFDVRVGKSPRVKPEGK